MGRAAALLIVAGIVLVGCEHPPMYNPGTGEFSSDPDDTYWANRKKDECGKINDEVYKRDCERKLDAERARGKPKS
jgi:hypothetical protein